MPRPKIDIEEAAIMVFGALVGSLLIGLWVGMK